MESKPLIAIYCNTFPPELSGAAGRVYNLARLLSQSGYQVQVICAMPNYPKGKIFESYRGKWIVQEELDGIRVTRVWMKASNSFLAWSRGFSMMSFIVALRTMAYRKVLKQEPSLVIVSSPPLLMAADVVRYFSRNKCPVLLNVSDIWPLSALSLGAVKKRSLFKVLQKKETEMYERANGFTAQSTEILEHIRAHSTESKPMMLYRNLPGTINGNTRSSSTYSSFQIIYPGVLGHAQGLLEICRQINFSELGVSLDIYGEGPEHAAIESYLKDHADHGIRLLKPVGAAQLSEKLPQYRAMLIPLVSPIQGAVPSKLYTAIFSGLPVLYSGGVEGREIVETNELGWVSAPGDMAGIRQNIQALRNQSESEFLAMKDRILKLSFTEFNKERQDQELLRFIKELRLK